MFSYLCKKILVAYSPRYNCGEKYLKTDFDICIYVDSYNDCCKHRCIPHTQASTHMQCLHNVNHSVLHIQPHD